jgi:hypothetical protein
MRDRFADVLSFALFHPQQAGNAPVFGLARPLGGEGETQLFGDEVFGVGAVQRARAELQRAALLAQEALGQTAWRAAQFEIEFHFGRGAAVIPGSQMLDRARAVALEEGGAYRCHQRALAGFVRSGEQIQAVAESAQFEGLAEAAELVDAQPGELHCAKPSRRAPSSPASSTSASRAVSQSVPSWAARSSATTSPR